MKKCWMVNCIVHSTISGLKGSLIGIYHSEDAAKTTVKLCIETFHRAYEDCNVEVDFDKMTAWCTANNLISCSWFITPIETP